MRTFRYGDDPAQVADLHLPQPAAGDRDGRQGRGVALLVHGGYWRACYDRTLQRSLVDDLVADGWAVWNVDYRGVGADTPVGAAGPDGAGRAGSAGGWPGTFLDVAAAADLLVDVAPEYGLLLDRVVAVGHSAGGTLALWLAGRHRLPAGTPGSEPRLLLRAVVAQAAICNLVSGAHDHLGGGAIPALMGAGPLDGPEAALAYALANPRALLPLSVPTLLVTGADDDTVPQSQSVEFARAATEAGDDVSLRVVPGEGHFVHLDPTSATWRLTRTWMHARLAD